MVCERVLGNLAHSPSTLSNEELDFIELQWFECARRALRKRTRGGRDLALLLPPGQILRHGDILAEGLAFRVAVEILPCEVLVARPLSAGSLALLAFELGNLHVPTELFDDEIRVAPNGPVTEVIERLGIPSEIQLCLFQPRFTAAGVTLSPLLQITRSSGAPTGKDGASD
jgi:urease accessory protein